MSKLPGFLVLLVAVFFITSIFAVSSSKSISNKNKTVLSDTGESGGGGGDRGGSSGGDRGSNTSGSSGGGSTTETKTGSGGSTNISPSSTPKVERKVENETETPKPEIPELENETELEVAEGTEAAKVKIASREGKFIFFEQKFGGESEFPVSINKTTRELTITTPAGVRTVTVLPDTAVENMLAQNEIDRVIGINGQIVEVKVGPDGNLIYEIKGAKNEKFLGLINVSIPKTLDVSTQNGQLLGVSQSPIDRFLELISF